MRELWVVTISPWPLEEIGSVPECVKYEKNCISVGFVFVVFLNCEFFILVFRIENGKRYHI